MLTPSEAQNATSTLSSLSKDKDVPKAPVLLALAIGYQRMGDAHRAKHELRKLQVKIGLIGKYRTGLSLETAIQLRLSQRF